MAYFDNVKLGYRVWSFEYSWGTVIKLENCYFVVNFDNKDIGSVRYTFDGKKFGDSTASINRTLFWDEVKIEIPEKPKIELKEKEYFIDFAHGWKLCPYCVKHTDGYDKEYKTYLANAGLTRNDKEVAQQALNQIKRFTRLLALRDQECPNSRGFNPRKNELKFAITYDVDEGMYLSFNMYNFMPDKVYFKTKEDAERICDILNSGRFMLDE